jgi:hypothetical protein
VTRLRVLVLALAAVATSALPVRADMAGAPSREERDHARMNQWLISQGQEPIPYEPSRRTGPFRSCGSGMGLGLAGVGTAWGLMWVGHRYAGRVARRP